MYDDEMDTVIGNKGDYWFVAHKNDTFEIYDTKNGKAICSENKSKCESRFNSL
jgi:hypothetical protein